MSADKPDDDDSKRPPLPPMSPRLRRALAEAAGAFVATLLQPPIDRKADLDTNERAVSAQSTGRLSALLVAGYTVSLFQDRDGSLVTLRAVKVGGAAVECL